MLTKQKQLPEITISYIKCSDHKAQPIMQKLSACIGFAAQTNCTKLWPHQHYTLCYYFVVPDHKMLYEHLFKSLFNYMFRLDYLKRNLEMATKPSLDETEQKTLQIIRERYAV